MFKQFFNYIKTKVAEEITEEVCNLLIKRVVMYDKKILDLHNRLIQQENLREQYEQFVRAHIFDIERRIKLIEENIKTK
jgi:hypothetical protein